MRKISVLLISLIIILLAVPNSFADVAKEADVLHSLGLLKGDESGFNLGGQLKRSEAVTFIVKVLGEEKRVLDNKSTYISKAFDDVPQDEWYAPFVGYCHINGIVSGFEDGSFRPNEYVTEKAFLTMLLETMNYDAGQDFDWNTVLSKAYSVGLVDDINYAVKTEDNANYIRGNVVSAIYKSLTKKQNGQNETVIEKLIRKKVTNKMMAKKYNLIFEDELKTEIDSAEVISVSQVKIELNEDIESIQKNDIVFTVDGVEVDISMIEQEGSEITFEVNTFLYEGKKYEVTIKALQDTHGHVMNNLQAELKGIKREVVHSDEFLISYIQAVSPSKVEVYFTQPIDEGALQPLYFKFGQSGNVLREGNFKNIEVQKIDGTDYGLLLHFKDFKMTSQFDYEVFIRGDIQSVYKQYLNEGSGDTYSFAGMSTEEGQFKVTDAEIVDEHYIEIEFNKVVSSESALEEDNYKLRDLESGSIYKPMRIEYYQDEEGQVRDRVMLRFNKLHEKREYEIEVMDVFEKYGDVRVERFEDIIEEGSFSDTALELENVKALDRNTIELIFSQALEDDIDSIDIDISNNIRVAEIYKDPSRLNRLVVYLSKYRDLDEDKEYEIEVSNIEDYLGRDIERDTSDEFDGSDRSRDDIDIVSAKYISDDLILVKLSDVVREKDLQNIDNYELEYRSGSTKKLFYPMEIEIVSYDEVLVRTEISFGDGSIRLYMKDVYDYSGQYRYAEISSDVER